MGFVAKHLCFLLLEKRMLKLSMFKGEDTPINASFYSCADITSGRDFLEMHLNTSSSLLQHKIINIFLCVIQKGMIFFLFFFFCVETLPLQQVSNFKLFTLKKSSFSYWTVLWQNLQNVSYSCGVAGYQGCACVYTQCPSLLTPWMI